MSALVILLDLGSILKYMTKLLEGDITYIELAFSSSARDSSGDVAYLYCLGLSMLMFLRLIISNQLSYMFYIGKSASTGHRIRAAAIILKQSKACYMLSLAM